MRLYNELSHREIEIDYDTPYCNRGKLDTGTHCNYRCGFCYYYNQLDQKTPFKEVKKRIDHLVECGIAEADLSGGESSIHADWFNILDYCKEKGLKVSCLSNGSMFSKYEFLEKSKQHGLDEILFSLHGFDEESHNKLVGVKAGFRKITQSIVFANQLGIKVRLNCTVTKDNYKELDNKFVDLVHQFDVAQVNFLTLNYWDDANAQDAFPYKEATESIKRAIDKLEVPDKRVRYTPFCYLKGYEKHLFGYYQHIYDLSDWNIATYGHTIDPREYVGNELKHLYLAAERQRNATYKKNKECLDCKHYYICDGYEKKHGELEVFPEPGEKIKKVTHYL